MPEGFSPNHPWLDLTALENETSIGNLQNHHRQTFHQILDQMKDFLGLAAEVCLN